MNQIEKIIIEKKIEVIFIDYYDTLVHRKVHPNYTLRVWSKLIIRELGLKTSVDELYFIFNESVLYLSKKLGKNGVELPYKLLQKEIATRLINKNILMSTQKESFIHVFEKAHLQSEISVQSLNLKITSFLKSFKEKGGEVYLISDYYGPKSLFIKMLEYHDIIDIFNGVYSSASVGKSKHQGNIYKKVLSDLNLMPNKVLMIGDNYRSDFINAKKSGVNSYLLPHRKYLIKNKLNNIGNDKKKLKNIVDKIYKNCNNSSSIPYSEYGIFYHFFVERLYELCKRENIRSLFFLSREGLFLKRLFDSYMESQIIDTLNPIRTHYLKISRQASLQITLERIEEEEFKYLKRKYKSISVFEFLSFFNFDDELKKDIIDTLDFNGQELINDFFNTPFFIKLKENEIFKKNYEYHRLINKDVFKEYLNSFNENIELDGINVVDIGWGGTMQESIYNFLEKKVKVTGYYLGLKDIYTLTNDTKRYGLNFSVLPFRDYFFNILKANSQLYEQFAAASHGYTVAYSKNDTSYTIEYHEPKEKWLYDNYIKDHQDEMFLIHKLLLSNLENVCYDQEMVQEVMVNTYLKSGLLQNTKKIKLLDALNTGFYQNIGNKKVGIHYELPKEMINIKEIINFMLRPEIYFSLLVKLKSMLHKKHKLFYYIFPFYFIYQYYRFNKYIRFSVLKKHLLLGFNYFK